MCGIAGIMMYEAERTQEQLDFIKILTAELANENQARGSHATGVATFNKEGHPRVLKADVKAETFTTLDSFYGYLDKNVNNDTRNILIHTRHATKGSKSNNDNNHPIVAKNVIGVHNGMLWNDDELFQDEKLFRLAEVDSEVIFRLADREENTRAGIKKVAEYISGSFAVAYVNKEEPDKLNYFRNNNPTTFALIDELNIIIFASEERFITSALGTANLASYQVNSYAIDEDVLTIKPDEDIVMQFDVKNDMYGDFYQAGTPFKENHSFGSWGYGGSGWMDDDYDYTGGLSTDDLRTKVDYILGNELGKDSFDTVMEFLQTAENDAWADGYKAGRASLDYDSDIRKELNKKAN